MKFKMTLSMKDLDAEHVAYVISDLEFLANITPMFSSVRNKETNRIDVENAVVVDFLEPLHTIHTSKILLVWEVLRERLGVHCVWLDIDGTHYVGYADMHEHSESYNGCICEWGYYKAFHNNIGHGHALNCSEY